MAAPHTQKKSIRPAHMCGGGELWSAPARFWVSPTHVQGEIQNMIWVPYNLKTHPPCTGQPVGASLCVQAEHSICVI